MNYFKTCPKTVAAITVASGLLSVLPLALLGMALANNPDAFSNLSLILNIPNVNASLIRWSMLTDLLGYYVLLLPILYYLRTYLRECYP